MTVKGITVTVNARILAVTITIAVAAQTTTDNVTNGTVTIKARVARSFPINLKVCSP